MSRERSRRRGPPLRFYSLGAAVGALLGLVVYLLDRSARLVAVGIGLASINIVAVGAWRLAGHEPDDTQASYKRPTRLR